MIEDDWTRRPIWSHDPDQALALAALELVERPFGRLTTAPVPADEV